MSGANSMGTAKAVYVSSARALGAVARAVGLLQLLERNRHSKACLYLRSLFSIYDASDLARLDLPWWTFGAIDHLNGFLQKHGRHMVVFEYGSGASTVWLGRRCRAVYSVEHDLEWAEQSRRLCAHQTNVHITTVPATPDIESARCRSERAHWTHLSFDRYVEYIRTYPFDFDLIVIDGRCRVDCLAEAQRKLKAGGLIVFDDSDRRRYRNAIKTTPMQKSVFRGLAPGIPFPGETTLLRAAAAGNASFEEKA